MTIQLLRATLLATALGSCALLAQGQPAPPAGRDARGPGRLTGTVTSEATGQPLAYASVAVLSAAGQPVGGAVGGDDGRFVLPGLAPGTYTVRVSLLGYQELIRPGVVVPAGGGDVSLGHCRWRPRPRNWAK
ncbi:carboxypeptidase regulatory-like domain-containing protein [Hymenobacter sp. BRD128]|uniref:carboxypeptidase-like regulatory domain-containing protein n=1 Tax=Hymenobacter sp. BRD128 TaxID=2675878 RepID=UPI001565C34E|nr:carboxypeptidase-like regulatory domain-containing protein [Hymenobacter sp. BRD128]QKG56396.1 carboxypeptidase regulatory-like domain-containing protein [Hymenobacter sp. BRD128]